MAPVKVSLWVSNPQETLTGAKDPGRIHIPATLPTLPVPLPKIPEGLSKISTAPNVGEQAPSPPSAEKIPTFCTMGDFLGKMKARVLHLILVDVRPDETRPLRATCNQCGTLETVGDIDEQGASVLGKYFPRATQTNRHHTTS